jgi:fumarate hydratase subunit beta
LSFGGVTKRITLPLTDEIVIGLRTGDKVLLTGVVYTARDASHQRMVEALDSGEPLPFDVKGQTLFFVGPTPARAGRPVGATTPTTSGRMDSYSPRLIAEGLKGMIGKGIRSQAVKDALKQYRAVYFGAVAGAGAFLSKRVRISTLLAYEDLGPQAVYRFEVEDFPAVVINDMYGGDLYEEEKARYRVS